MSRSAAAVQRVPVRDVAPSERRDEGLVLEHVAAAAHERWSRLVAAVVLREGPISAADIDAVIEADS